MQVPILDITARAIPPESAAPMSHCSEERPAGCFGELLAKPMESPPREVESREEPADEETAVVAHSDAESTTTEEVAAPADDNEPTAQLEEKPDEPEDAHESEIVAVNIAAVSFVNVLPEVVAEPIAVELPAQEVVVQAATPIEVVDSVPLQPVPAANRMTPALQPGPEIAAAAAEPVSRIAEPVVPAQESLEVTTIVPILPRSIAPLPTKPTAEVQQTPSTTEQTAPAELPAINAVEENDSQPQSEQHQTTREEEAPVHEPRPTLTPTNAIVDVLAPLAAVESASTEPSSGTEPSARHEPNEAIAAADTTHQPTTKTDTTSQPPPVATTRLPAEVLGIGPSTSAPVSDPAPVRLLQRVARAFAVARPDSGEVTLRLSPPELGSLRLEVRVHQGAIVARMEAETSTARNILVDNLPALRDRLAEQGVRIERFDIDLMQRHTGGAFDRSAQQQNNEPAPLPQPQPSRTVAPAESPRTRTHMPSPIDSKRLNVIV